MCYVGLKSLCRSRIEVLIPPSFGMLDAKVENDARMVQTDGEISYHIILYVVNQIPARQLVFRVCRRPKVSFLCHFQNVCIRTNNG